MADLHYTPQGAARELFNATDREIMLAGPANTGKTLAICMYLHALCEQHAGTRILMIRKTRRSLTEAALQKLEDHILVKLHHPALGGRARRANRTSYDYPNGSTIVTGCMEEPTRYYSTEWSIVYVNEATELLLDQWERFQRAIRHKAIPHPTKPGEFLQQIIGDCNPDTPTSWILKRAQTIDPQTGKPRLRMLQCAHSDNPSFTKQDQEALDALTGVRRSRLRDGLWVAAEGQIWETYDPHFHVVKDFPRDSSGAPEFKFTVMGQDWGTRKPGCLQVWGVDFEGAMWLVEEWYAAGNAIDWWIRKATLANEQWKPIKCLCDPEDQSSTQLYRRAGIPAEDADKRDKRSSYDQVSDRLARDRITGKARMYFWQDAPRMVDQQLAATYQPVSTVEEIPGFTYRKAKDGQVIKEESDPLVPDHGCDTMRYVTRYVDRHFPSAAIVSAPTPWDSARRRGESDEEMVLRGIKRQDESKAIVWPWS